MVKAITAACGALAAFHLCFITALALVQPDPYMDEEFHFDQTQAYCSFRYEYYNPKLTVFPGTFLVSSGAAILLKAILGPQLACSLTVMRAVSAAFHVATLAVSHNIVRIVNPSLEMKFSVSLALSAVSFPPLFFSAGLHYTDTMATFAAASMVLSAYMQHSGLYFAASLFGLAIRQTNIIWAAFAAGVFILESSKQNQIKQNPIQTAKGVIKLLLSPKGFHRFKFVLLALGLCMAILLAVVWKTGSIVLGDKSNHVPVKHFAQMVYMPTAVFLSAAPAFVAAYQWSSAMTTSMAKLSVAGVWLVLCTAAVHFGMYEHPFILADNRHYTFYIWRRLKLGTPLRFWLCPIYCLACVAISLSSTAGRHPLLRNIGLLVCCCAVLIPSPLMEPRYYCVPALLIITHLRVPPSTTSKHQARKERMNSFLGAMQDACAEIIHGITQHWHVASVGLLMVVNTMAALVFLLKPFQGPSGTSRFMW